MIAQRFLPDILVVLSSINVDPLLALVVVGRVAELVWDSYEDQEWFLYIRNIGELVSAQAMEIVVRCSAAGLNDAEGGRAALSPKFCPE